MKYVYILQSLDSSERYYIGVTDDLRSRLAKHNAGEVSHTSKYRPWRVKTYVDRKPAAGSGTARCEANAAGTPTPASVAFELTLERLRASLI